MRRSPLTSRLHFGGDLITTSHILLPIFLPYRNVLVFARWQHHNVRPTREIQMAAQCGSYVSLSRTLSSFIIHKMNMACRLKQFSSEAPYPAEFPGLNSVYETVRVVLSKSPVRRNLFQWESRSRSGRASVLLGSRCNHDSHHRSHHW